MKIFKRYLKFLFATLVLSAVLFNWGSIRGRAEELQTIDLKNKVIPLKTTKAGNGFEDLDKLQEILKDKQIVAMGEATHGTKEFFQMKHRMFEFLVEKMGYRVFAIEGNFDYAQDVNDYILNGRGNADDVVKAMGFSVWSTEEVVDMVKWMRNYNKNPEHKRKIKFYGFDIQSEQKSTAKVLAYIKKVDNNNLLKSKEKLFDIDNKTSLLSKDKLKDIKELKSVFEKNKKSYIEKSSSSEYEIAYQNLNVITQYIEYIEIIKNPDWRKSANLRDYYMAQNVKWILDYEKEFGNDKIMLWAHNGHVTKKFFNYTSMGENLKKVFNDKFYSIGFDFYEGSFRAMICNNNGTYFSKRMAKFNVDGSDSNSLAYSFAKTGIPLSFIDFKSASEDKNIKEWLSQRQLTHTVGAGYNGKIYECMLPEVPVESYDGLIFVKKTSAAVGIKGYETSITHGDTIAAIYRNIHKAVMVFILIGASVIIVRVYKKRKKKV